MQTDYLVVGAGLTGCVIARELRQAGFQVLIVEQNEYVGGNVNDYQHYSGVRIHRHGPHYFRCGSAELWQYLRQFADFYDFKARLSSMVNGFPQPWPIQVNYINKRCGANWQPAFKGIPRNFEEACLAKMPQEIYADFIQHYTHKQWDIHPTDLAASLASRISINTAGTFQLEPSKRHHGLPLEGYTAMIEKMINGIPRFLSCNFLKHKEHFHVGNKVIYTGPIDAYFNFDLGYLDYRSQRREHVYYADENLRQDTVQINYPAASEAAIRSIEWKHLLPETRRHAVRGTVVTHEYPRAARGEDHLEYPVPDARNAELYKLYRQRADQIDDVLICGRLGEYRYYDMDQAIARARVLATDLISQDRQTQ